ncbi:helix-turn-helix domain containing protein [Leifsonia sp. H3M29-4]|uniref:TetR/AcrR family transcriptional regulator n=1 Tax=Salinibacterium metalliresistens TaxID=3031321 RepID=UPI0023DA9D66|nr:TetR/AcrR family transcriptional regulator [Salinibacterium metalliresistens]MDF1477539.1 helix-turn-helix domain containing protein [Salinibacterium metalliresistens]
MGTNARVNRGPAAAAQNRAAIIRAAGEIFAEQGLNAPLNAIAKRAGVGQGSLYRHFPTRASLAYAAFDQGLAEIEALTARGGTLAQVLALVTEQARASVAFLELLAPLAQEPDWASLGVRIRAVIEATIVEGVRSGTVPAHYTVDDVLLAIRMVAGALAGSVEGTREAVSAGAWRLLGIEVHT